MASPFDHAWALLKQQALPPHPAAIQGLMARQYAADDENRMAGLGRHEGPPPSPDKSGEVYDEMMEEYLQDKAAGHHEPWHHSEFESDEGPSGSDLRQRMDRDESRGNIARRSTGLARGGSDEHIDQPAWDQLGQESRGAAMGGTDEHIDADAWNQLGAESRPDPRALAAALQQDPAGAYGFRPPR
jgi:hypothetical protein